MTTAVAIHPLWEHFPPALTERDRWVVWRSMATGKVPYSATTLKRVDVTQPGAGATLAGARRAYEGGGFAGVGFVLDGSGVVVADLDDCVRDGCVSPGAMQVLRTLGAGYVEVSPSGFGLHAFGLVETSAPGRKIEVDGTRLELYSRERYMTVTGHRLLPDFPDEDLGDLPGFNGLCSTSDKGASGRRRSQVPSTGVVIQARSYGFPAECIPIRVGQRNSCIFRLARHLRAAMPDSTEDERYEIFREWFEVALPNIGTLDEGISWSDFINAWENVKAPEGAAVMVGMIDRGLPELPLHWIKARRFGEVGVKILRLCLALAEHHAPDPFFAAGRPIAEAIGCHHTSVTSVLSAAVKCGLLRLVRRGFRGTASTYMLVAEPETPADQSRPGVSIGSASNSGSSLFSFHKED